MANMCHKTSDKGLIKKLYLMRKCPNRGEGLTPIQTFFMKELTIYQKGGIFEVSSQHIKANFTSNLSPKMLFAGFPFLFYLEYEGAFQVFLH